MSNMDKPWLKFICRACGLIYDEAIGDPDSGLAPGTRFEDIPDDWECPLCGVTKIDFEPYQEREATVGECQLLGNGARQTGIIVVGAGLAGWSVAESLRALDNDIPITLVTACSGDRYHKPELSVAISRKLTRPSLVRETAAEAAQRLGIRLYSETFVVGLSTKQHKLRTTRGTLSYTKLILAQGARPALPAELPPALCWRINDLNGWHGLQAQLSTKSQHVAIIGAGMVGCELAEDFAMAGHIVTLLDRQNSPLARVLPAVASQRLRKSLEQLGVEYIGAAHVAEVRQMPGNVKRIKTKCGRHLSVDHVVAATGLITDTRLALSAGLAFDNGIKVDRSTLQTSDPDTFALGDCISIDGQPCRFIEPIARQARTIAHAVLGRNREEYLHSAPVVRLKTRSLPIEFHGMPVDEGEWRILQESKDHLMMEQWFNGSATSTLRVGKTKAA